MDYPNLRFSQVKWYTIEFWGTPFLEETLILDSEYNDESIHLTKCSSPLCKQGAESNDIGCDTRTSHGIKNGTYRLVQNENQILHSATLDIPDKVGTKASSSHFRACFLFFFIFLQHCGAFLAFYWIPQEAMVVQRPPTISCTSTVSNLQFHLRHFCNTFSAGGQKNVATNNCRARAGASLKKPILAKFQTFFLDIFGVPLN